MEDAKDAEEAASLAFQEAEYVLGNVTVEVEQAEEALAEVETQIEEIRQEMEAAGVEVPGGAMSLEDEVESLMP